MLLQLTRLQLMLLLELVLLLQLYLPKIPPAGMRRPRAPRPSEVPVGLRVVLLLLLLLLLAGHNLSISSWIHKASSNSGAEDTDVVGVSVVPAACCCCCRASIYVAAGPPNSWRAPSTLRLPLRPSEGAAVGPTGAPTLQTEQPQRNTAAANPPLHALLY